MKRSPNAAYWICAQTGVTGLASGMPGEAKTSLVNAFGRVLRRRTYTLIGSIREPADVGGYPHLHAPKGEIACMKLVPPDWVVGFLNGEKWVLFIDELTCCQPATQAAFLRIITEKYVGDTQMPSDTIIMAACNPTDVAAGGSEIEPPLANRMYHHKWEMPWDAFDQGLRNGLVFPEPEIPIIAENWRDGLAQVGGMAAAFRVHRPNLFSNFPTKSRAEACGPWPSPRSWTNGVQLLAAAQSISSDEDLQAQLLSGCIGANAAEEYFEWQRHLDLPNPEDMIAQQLKGKFKYKRLDRTDKVFALLSSLAHAVTSKLTKERLQAGIDIIELASKHDMDAAIVCMRPLAKLTGGGTERPFKDVKFSDAFAERVSPIMDRVNGK